jgi:ankyrin repeat protein
VSELLSLLYQGKREEAEAYLASDPPPVLDIFEAAAAGSHKRVAELLRGDESLALAWTDDGFTALHLACFFGTPDAALDLLEAGADPNVASRNDMGVRPINSAAAGREPFDMVRLLLDRGADIDGTQTSGHTALDEARARGEQQLIDLLTVRGATP